MNENLKMALERNLVVCIQYTYVSTKNFLNNSDFIFFKVNSGHQRSNLARTRPIGVKSGRLVGIYQIYIFFVSECSQEFKFYIFQGQLGSSEVELGSYPSNRGQIVPIGRNISNMHMFRLIMLSGIVIQSYFRSN